MRSTTLDSSAGGRGSRRASHDAAEAPPERRPPTEGPPPTTRTGANVLAGATARLQRAGIDTPRLDAELLLAHAFGISRGTLLAHLQNPVTEPTAVALKALLARRLLREPLAYITGEREFWSLALAVTRDTLIPRPETEMIVERALDSLAGSSSARVLDIGTGSGCIAIALAVERRDAVITAIDISPNALRVAAANAARHGVEDRIAFLHADVRDVEIAERFDLVVANPPYIRSGDLATLTPEVAAWEPRTALDGGLDGLNVVRAVLSSTERLLRPGGWLIMEIGSDQATAVASLVRESGFVEVEVRPDYAGLPRALLARRSYQLSAFSSQPERGESYQLSAVSSQPEGIQKKGADS